MKSRDDDRLYVLVIRKVLTMATATIDDLPFEILEIIFKELCLKDITNCSHTCLRWNYCIEALFRDKGRIAVIAGENRGWAQHTEVIDLTSSDLKYDLLPDVSERFGSVGGRYND